MTQTKSRFGSNLLAQLLLGVVLGMAAEKLPPGSRDMLDTVGKIFFFSFWFGLVYGFFRLFGARGDALEWYYQNIPYGIGLGGEAPAGPARGGPPPLGKSSWEMGDTGPSGAAEIMQPGDQWSWDQLLTPRYIRFAGLLLVVSAIFSVLFKIEWDTLQKIIAADAGAVILLAGAEWGKRRSWNVFSAISFLVSYAWAQFSLTLMFALSNEDGMASVEKWLIIKVLVMIAGIPFLRRYAAEYSPLVYACISYSAPFTLLRIVPAIDPTFGFVWTLAMSVVVLFISVSTRSYELAPLNSVAGFIHIMGFLMGGGRLVGARSVFNIPPDIAVSAFVAVLTLYVFQMIADFCHHRKEPALDEGVLVFHALLTHVFTATCLATIQYVIPSIAGYHGVTWLMLSLVGFAICLTYDRTGIRNRYVSMLLHISLALSALGLFVQAQGTWTAIVFLLYSCAVLYASLLYATRTTKIFAFFVLTLSLLKLYLECSELFETLPGTSAVFVIGCLLLLLSNRFEAVKRLVQESPSPKGPDAGLLGKADGSPGPEGA